MEPHDVVIVGAGPAGIATTIQLLREGLDPLLLETGLPGGLLWNAHRVENYPGFPGGISGPRLARRMVRQLRQTGGVIRPCHVHAIEAQNSFRLETSAGTIDARQLVLATGTQPIDGPPVDIPAGVKHRVFRHVWPLRRERGRDFAILGAGDAAFDYALTLARHNQVHIIARSGLPRALPRLRVHVDAHPRIGVHLGRTLESIRPDGPRLRLMIGSARTVDDLIVDGLVIAIGRVPALGCLCPSLFDQRQELVDSGRLFLIGDVQQGIFRQTSIAVGDGVRAAMRLCRMREGCQDADR